MSNDHGQEELPVYATTDFYTTAVLVLNKFEVIEIRKDEQNRRNKTKYFVFRDSPELRQLILDYMNSSLMGNLRDFRHAIDTVKDMVHSG